MRPGCETLSEPGSRLERARQLLRAQLDALVALAAVATWLIEGVAPPRVAFDPARPMAGVVALERAIGKYARVSWALRLIWALRAKLAGDLARVERGEGVDAVLAAQARASLVVQAPHDDDHDEDAADPESDNDAERREASGGDRERPERERFGRYLSAGAGEAEFSRILRRPTDEVIALIREALRLGLAEPPHDGEAPPRPNRPRPTDLGLGLSRPVPPPGPAPRSLC